MPNAEYRFHIQPTPIGQWLTEHGHVLKGEIDFDHFAELAMIEANRKTDPDRVYYRLYFVVDQHYLDCWTFPSGEGFAIPIRVEDLILDPFAVIK